MKIKASPTSPKSRVEKENTISNLYKDNDVGKIERAKPSPPGLFTIVFLSIIFGFLAGLLSIILFFMYGSEIPLLKDIGLASNLSQTLMVIKQQKNNVIIQNNEKMQLAIEKVSPAIVDIFVKKPTNATELDQIYLINERKGEGLILTNDGLIITTNQVVDNLKEDYVVITSDNKIYSASNYLEDPVTGTVFIKIEAVNLPVVDFANLEDINYGDEVFVLQNNINSFGYDLSLTNIKNLNYRNISSPSELVETSEKLSKKILINEKFDSFTKASPVINLDGKIVGLLVENEKLNFVLPIQFIKTILSGVLKNNKIERPYLGVHYISLSEAINIPDKLSQGRNKGALIYSSDPKNPSIEIKSPAQKAGLKEGDIILKVNGLIIDQKNSLTYYIQDSKIGDIVNLSILRSGSEKEIKVELEKMLIKNE